MRIENNGAQTVQLRTRHWHITDADGNVQEVRGAGVVGEQPVLRPGEAFEVHQRHAAHHSVRDYGRLVPHGDRGRRVL